MMMRVKLVIINNSAGRKVSPVRSSRVWIDSDHWVPPPGAGVLVTAGSAWASAAAGSRQRTRISVLLGRMAAVDHLAQPAGEVLSLAGRSRIREVAARQFGKR